MTEQTTEAVSMTAEEKAQFEAFKAEQAKKAREQKRKENREAYAAIVDEQIEEAIPMLIELSEEISARKTAILNNFQQVLEMKAEIMEMSKPGQYSHTFTNSAGDKRITLGVNTVDAYRDTVEEGIEKVRLFIESLAKDDNSRTLVNAVMRLLSRDQRGTLKASRVLQLRKMADESGDEQFLEGVRIIEESYQPTITKTYIRAERKDEIGAWRAIPLGMTEA